MVHLETKAAKKAAKKMAMSDIARVVNFVKQDSIDPKYNSVSYERFVESLKAMA